ncbi:hypothetical protein, partial [Paenibacillus chitinolyticus]|uniref:hypothetical protein n=1 Tax=Paenibacillus chitinolyticus TaxID=79263 RepID=UPI00366FC81C
VELRERPVRHADAVSWTLTRSSKNVFVLRNTGTETAAGVKVDLGHHPAGLTRRVPEDGVVRKGESTDFMVMSAWGSPIPRELWVSWDGCDETAVLPVPQWG